MKKILLLLLTLQISLASYNPIIISNRVCFTVPEANDILKKLKLYKLDEDIIKEQTQTIEALNLSSKYMHQESILNNIYIGAGSFITGIIIGIISKCIKLL